MPEAQGIVAECPESYRDERSSIAARSPRRRTPGNAERSVCYLFRVKARPGKTRRLCSFLRQSLSLAGASNKLMFKQSVPRLSSFLPLLLLFSIQCVLFGTQAPAQTLKNFDAAVSGFAQFTGTADGNGIRDVPTRSGGGLATFRQSFKPWLGYEVNYSYTRFSEGYTGQPFLVQDNVHETTGAYLVQLPKLLVFQPFAAAGFGSLLFLPTAVGGQHYNQQFRLAFLYEVGLNYPLITDHFGVRIQYRGLMYKTPDFNQPYLATNTRRLTSEPTIGLYVRF